MQESIKTEIKINNISISLKEGLEDLRGKQYNVI